MDDIDRAQNHIEKELPLCIEQGRSFAEPHPVGECLNCGERLTDGHLYGDDDCRAQYERRQKCKRIVAGWKRR